MPGLSEEGKVIVRSDGTVTYVGKDIAYQLWKFGLLGKDFYYRPFHTYADGRVLWVTTDEPSGNRAAVRARRARLQRHRRAPVLFAGRGGGRAARPGLHRRRPISRSTSPTRWWRFRRAAARNWASQLSEEDRARPYVEVSGRKGLGVKADDLMDKLIAKALEEVASRHAGGSAGGAAARGQPDRHRRAALLPAEVHAQLR